MASNPRRRRFAARILSLGRRRTLRFFSGAVVASLAVVGAAFPAAAVAPAPTLTVVVLGGGKVTSLPAGISCPGKCTATFAPGTSVQLIPTPNAGSAFLRWGGSCAGAAACKVRVTSLAAVAAQFAGGTKTTPEPPVKSSLAAPGPYSGTGGIAFYVAPGGHQVLNLTVHLTYLSCTPSGAINDHLGILKVAIKPGGSFSAKTAGSGILQGSTVRFVYTVAGRFEAATTTANASATGTWREDVTFASGTLRSCTSNPQVFTATLFREPPQTKVLVSPGDYTGTSGLTFTVAPGGTSLLNVAVRLTYLSCTPTGAANDHLTIATVAIKPDGSFHGVASASGVLLNNSAKFTYTIAGSFEGATQTGPATVAGIFNERVTFASGSDTACTSNDQLWTATKS